MELERDNPKSEQNSRKEEQIAAMPRLNVAVSMLELQIALRSVIRQIFATPAEEKSVRQESGLREVES